MTCSCSESASLILSGIQLVLLYADSRGAEMRVLESNYLRLLREICALTEQEADLVEPAFTRLETRIQYTQTPSARM